MGVIIILVVGALVGWLAGMIMRSGGGIIFDIVVGIVGALIGGWLFSTMGVSTGGGLLGAIIVALVGAIILIFLLRLIKRT